MERIIPSFQELVKSVYGVSYIQDTSYVCPPIKFQLNTLYSQSYGGAQIAEQYGLSSERFQQSPSMRLVPFPFGPPPPPPLPHTAMFATPVSMTPSPVKSPQRCPYCGDISIIKWKRDKNNQHDGCRECYLKLINGEYKVRKRSKKIRKKKKVEMEEVEVIEINLNSE